MLVAFRVPKQQSHRSSDPVAEQRGKDMFSKNTLVGTLMVVSIGLLAAACGAAVANPGGEPTTTIVDRSSESFVGLSVEAAGLRAEDQGRPWRVIREDGVDHAVTEDYSEHRLNFTVEDGIVVAAQTDAEMVGGSSGIEPGEQNRESLSFIGLTVDEARARAEGQERAWRVIREDGVDLVITMEYSEDRLNFTVEDGVVVDAKTDAEMVEGGGASVCEGVNPVVDGGEILGTFDINDDGRDETLVIIQGDSELAAVAIWTLDADCNSHRVTLEGAPALLAVGISESAAFGVSCQPQYVDDLYTIELASNDGTTYEGRIIGYELQGSSLVEVDGEGAGFSREGAKEMAVLSCGELSHP